MLYGSIDPMLYYYPKSCLKKVNLAFMVHIGFSIQLNDNLGCKTRQGYFHRCGIK